MLHLSKTIIPYFYRMMELKRTGATMLFCAGVLLLQPAHILDAQENIAAARAMNPGSKVSISGIVSNGDELGTIRYMQDESAGIAVYSEMLKDVKRGDSITVSGTLKDYENLLEIDPVSSFHIHSSGHEPSPLELSPSQFKEEYEGMLVRVKAARFKSTGTFSRRAYSFEASGEPGQVYINDQGSPLIGMAIPAGTVDLTGALGAYRDRYQLLPRDVYDIQPPGRIRILGLVSCGEINNGGFSLSWETDSAGSTALLYGRSPELELGLLSVPGSSTTHQISLNGFRPSELLYARAFSVRENDTAWAPRGTYMTGSNSTGEIRVLFNRAIDESVSLALLEPEYVAGNLDDELITCIEAAEESIDMAIYNINDTRLASITGALNRAHNRGVRVRVVYNKDSYPVGVGSLHSAIGKIASPQALYPDYGIMHNKFIVIDARSEDPDRPLVWTGSTNLTENQIKVDPNNVIVIQDQSLALAYTMEFEEMFGSGGSQPDPDNARFGPDKTDNTPHDFLIGGRPAELYFSPTDGTNSHIIHAINSATSTVDVATMLITRPDIASALIAARRKGCEVQIIIDDSDQHGKAVLKQLLAEEGIVVKKHKGDGLLHHKYMIVDQNMAEKDPLLLTGSHNWSNSAELRNDENTLIVHDQGVANAYFQEFSARFRKGIPLGEDRHNTGHFTAIEVFPNPASSHFSIRKPADAGLSHIGLCDQTGREVAHWQEQREGSYTLPALPAGYYILQLRFKDLSRYSTPLLIE
ncbi:MAG: hypothetical protein CSA96_00100 [Bacteroidetes bacterium]|nr:MAG: hypothetical protein CSA96_00100 [Bacteroidota bacterium]